MKPLNFVLIWLATFGFWGTVAFLSLLYPIYLTQSGIDASSIGFITGFAAIGGLFGRFAVGWLVDRSGTRWFLLIGGLIMMLTGPLVPYFNGETLQLTLRFVQGIGGSLFTAGALAFVSYMTPFEQRGRTMSWWDTSGGAANLITPVLAAFLVSLISMEWAFAVAGLVALITVLAALPLPAARPPAASIPSTKLFSRGALVPGVFTALVGYVSGTVFVMAPIIGGLLGLSNVGVYVTVLSVGTLVVRPLTAWLSDRKGRAWVIMPGMLVMALALYLIVVLRDPIWGFVPAFLFGMGNASAIPGLMAWSIDRSGESERGAAVNTFYGCFEIGIFLGASAQGVLVSQSGLASYTFTGIVMLVAAGLYAGWLYLERSRQAHPATS